MLSRSISRARFLKNTLKRYSTISKDTTKTNVFSLQQIEKCVEDKSMIIDSMKEAFVSYSLNKVHCPSVLHFGGDEAPFTGEGDCVLKSGYIKGGKYYVVKVAGGSFKGQTTSVGVMLVFSQVTGGLIGILLDEGLLTELRTAAACSLSAKYFAPKNINCIGIVGTGIQARYQMEMLNHIQPSLNCSNFMVYGRSNEKIQLFKNDMMNKCKDFDISISTTTDLTDIGKNCDLIITATTAKEPVLFWEKHISKNVNNNGIHIICMGADTNTKQELDVNIIKNVDLLIADSIEQCCQFGELQHNVKKGNISKNSIYEIGDILANRNELFRQENDNRITMFDSTGIAPQDIVIAKMVYETLISQE
eukprot:64803_1